jgi:hypothetical protein
MVLEIMLKDEIAGEVRTLVGLGELDCEVSVDQRADRATFYTAEVHLITSESMCFGYARNRLSSLTTTYPGPRNVGYRRSEKASRMLDAGR